MLEKNRSQEKLIERLKDDAQADAYFYEVLEQCKDGDKEKAQEHLIAAMKNITEAQGGFAHLLNESGAESFYKMLSFLILKFVR